jgi:superfamily I DNA and/or RNA helicase
MEDLQRINVALTRAKHGLVIVGCVEALSKQSASWRALLKEMKPHIVKGLDGAKQRLDQYQAEKSAKVEDIEFDFI